MKNNRWWVSWYSTTPGGFEIHSPWWVSGTRCEDGAETICAAIIAASEEDAMAAVLAAHDDPHIELEFRFTSPRPDDWTPYCDRFQESERGWMKWPAHIDGTPA